MWGAIAGDIIGSIYERRAIKTESFPLFQDHCRFTDDTVMTVATAVAITDSGDYAAEYRKYGRQYPDAGYGGTFIRWLHLDNAPAYNSWGNGSAMRVSPVGWAFDDLDAVLREAERSAVVTHDHPEGIRGALAVAAAVWLARHGAAKDDLRREISGRFGYNLTRSLADIRPIYAFDVSCQGSVPEALIAFLESTGYEDAVRKAVSLGGDSDTQACIAGAVAQAFYGGVPAAIQQEARRRLPADLLTVSDEFDKRYISA